MTLNHIGDTLVLEHWKGAIISSLQLILQQPMKYLPDKNDCEIHFYNVFNWIS